MILVQLTRIMVNLAYHTLIEVVEMKLGSPLRLASPIVTLFPTIVQDQTPRHLVTHLANHGGFYCMLLFDPRSNVTVSLNPKVGDFGRYV